MRTKDEEQQFVERTENEVREGLLYLIRGGYFAAVNRIIEACKGEHEKLDFGLELVRIQTMEARDELLKVIEEAKDYE